MSVRIDHIAGVDPSVTFSSTHKHMAIRTDGDEDHCYYQEMVYYGYTEEDAFNRFRDCCIRRQNDNVLYKTINENRKAFECQLCKCGEAIATGKRKTLPVNVPWKQWPTL